MNFDLSQMISFADLAVWRLHWIMCDVWQVKETRQKYGWEHTWENIEKLTAILEGARIKFDRLVTEINHMSRDGYSFDIEASLRELPKYHELTFEMEKAASIITTAVKQLQQNEANRFQRHIDRAINL